MRVGIDLDGVCYDFSASLREYLRESGINPDGELADATRWEFYEDWGYTLDEFLEHCHAGVDAGYVFRHGRPYANTREAFDVIRAAGHTIHIVTDRSFGTVGGASQAATSEWLRAYGLSYDSLTFTADKTVVRLDTMVDDKLANYDALEAAGVAVYLLTRPWNKQEDDRHRVLDLLHYAEVICHA
jgi:5'(3')-deoxyribonucleotidase